MEDRAEVISVMVKLNVVGFVREDAPDLMAFNAKYPIYVPATVAASPPMPKTIDMIVSDDSIAFCPKPETMGARVLSLGALIGTTNMYKTNFCS